MATYDKKAGAKVKAVMEEKKAGTLTSGGSGKNVTSRKQAIAIALSEARKQGDRVPEKNASASKAAPAKKVPANKTAVNKARGTNTTATKKAPAVGVPAKKAARGKTSTSVKQ